MKKDRLFCNGKIITMDANCSITEALHVKNGKIHEAGKTSELLRGIGPGFEVVDLKGKTVLPGFIDSHVHLSSYGMMKLLGVELGGCSDISGIINKIREKSEHVPAGEWILGFGFDQTKLKEKRYPSGKELDLATSRHPVLIIRTDGHSSVANGKAMARINLPESAAGIEKGPKGNPTGVLRLDANSLAKERSARDYTNPANTAKSLDLAAGDAARAGITTLHTMEGSGYSNDEDVEVLLARQPYLPVRTVLYWQSRSPEMVAGRGISRIGGCFGVMADGSIGSHTAALYEPYHDNQSCTGTLYWEDHGLRSYIKSSHLLGLQISIHAIGDRAIGQVLSAFETVLSESPRPDHRHRIEHFVIPTRDQIEKAARMGIAIATQPAFEHYWGGEKMYLQRLGPGRVNGTHPLKSSLKSGLLVSGGSDCFVTPMNPLLGIYASVNHPNPLERLDKIQALRLFTTGGAYIAFEEKLKGSLEKGKLADFVVLDEDILSCPPEEIKDITVSGTIVGGEIIHWT